MTSRFPFREVSHGTMRDRDLLPTFIHTATQLIEWRAMQPGMDDPHQVRVVGLAEDKLGRIESAMARAEDSGVDALDDFFESEAAAEYVHDLFDVLSDLAQPFGYTFSSCEGDGACYGFWEIEEEDLDEESEG